MREVFTAGSDVTFSSDVTVSVIVLLNTLLNFLRLGTLSTVFF